MIRHAGYSTALSISALAVTMIEAPFLRALMPEVGGPALNPPGCLAAGVAAIDLPPIAMRTDEEDKAAIRRATRALPERGVTVSGHIQGRRRMDRGVPKVGKFNSSRSYASVTEHPT
jgi:hypothetical protein